MVLYTAEVVEYVLVLWVLIAEILLVELVLAVGETAEVVEKLLEVGV